MTSFTFLLLASCAFGAEVSPPVSASHATSTALEASKSDSTATSTGVVTVEECRKLIIGDALPDPCTSVAVDENGNCASSIDQTCLQMGTCRLKVAALNRKCTSAKTGVDANGNVYCQAVHDPRCAGSRSTLKLLFDLVAIVWSQVGTLNTAPTIDAPKAEPLQ